MSEGLAQHQLARDCAAPGTRGPTARLVAALRAPAVRARNIDLLAAAIAATLPWSTTAPAVFMVLWLIALAPTVDLRALLRSLARPACALPLAFFALALIGTLWSDSTWAARLHGINPLSKLLAIPILLYHFERS